MRKTLKTRVAKILSLAVVLCMMLVMVLPVSAEEGVLVASEDPRDSVMQISLGYEDDGGNFLDYKWGTCFLINDEYVLTNKHVVTLTQDEFNELKALVGDPNMKETDEHIKLYLYVNRDMRVQASVHNSVNSDDMDFAAVKLAEKIYDRKPVAIGDSDTIETRDTVYAIGFPADSISNKEYNTKEDVSTVDGTISKVTVTGNVDIIEHTAPLNLGNSGGPLLDENDCVIGVNTFIAGKKNYSIQINAIKKGLDTFGIPYVDPEPGPPEPKKATAEEIAALQAVIDEAKGYEADVYTEESFAALNDSIKAAEAVAAQGEEAEKTAVEAATNDLNNAIVGLEEPVEEKKGPNLLLIGGIAAAVVIIIIIAVIIAVSSSKKKKAAANAKGAMPMGSAGPAGGTAPISSISTQPQTSGQQSVPEGSDETRLLDAGAGATALLGGGASAYLIRKKNGEKIALNLQNFKIGKERRRVNYCVADNTTVSRLHCEIVKKGADYFVVDQGSANYTYVNGVQVSPHKETLLTDRSVLKLSDEEFEFHLS